MQLGGGERVQIKSRKSWTTVTVNPIGRLGRFSKKGKYDFDQGIFVELDNQHEVVKIWQPNTRQIKALESKEAKGRGLHVYAFQQARIIVYQRRKQKEVRCSEATK